MFIATSWETANDRMVIERIFSVDSRIKLWKITEFCSFQTSRVKRFKKLLKEFNRFSRSIIKYKLCYYFVFSYLLQLKGAQWSSNNAFIYWNRKLCLKLQKTIIFINKEPSKICKNQDCYSQRPFLPTYSLFIQVLMNTCKSVILVLRKLKMHEIRKFMRIHENEIQQENPRESFSLFIGNDQ